MKQHQPMIFILLALALAGPVYAMDKGHETRVYPTHLWGATALGTLLPAGTKPSNPSTPRADIAAMKIEQLQGTYDSCHNHVRPEEYRLMGLYLAALRCRHDIPEKHGISPAMPLEPIEQGRKNKPNVSRPLRPSLTINVDLDALDPHEEALTATTIDDGYDSYDHLAAFQQTLRFDDDGYPLGWC